ncbi:MAG: EAL domain-containing protein, partial [Lachnospiraceae bacterium]|nr:EAL domain-containing protein [Lachnospiraceae bacterium]
ILFYLVSSLVALTVEYFIPSALVELFSQSISILGVIFTIDNLRELTDDNTNAYNQMALEEDLHLLLSAHQDFHVFVINVPHIMDSIPVLGAAPIFKILMDVSNFLRSFPGTTVYHCGGGHFAMIYLDGSRREEMLEAITARFREPWIYENIQLNLNMELCYAESPDEIRSLKDFFLIMQAPVRNTTAVPNNINVYDYQRYLRERQLLEALHKALHTHGFEIYYQPIMDVANHAIHSAEALIRLNDDVLGYISPEEFISIAERHGLIIEIGDYVMEEVCRFICENDIRDYGIQYIDINLSPIQCMDQKLASRFLDIMKKYHVATNQINFELTEAAINRNHEILPLMIERFSKRGVYITLDDYGTGNSNISTIFQLPFLMVKLDKNILWNAEKSKRSLEILKHTMSLVKNMGMKLLVEGIETEHQLNWLLENGVDYCQGYYFSRAVPGGDFLRFIEHFNHMEE